MGGPHAYREHRPPPAWRHAVVCCWELRVGTSGAQRVLPDGCADLLIVDGGPLSVVGTADAVDLPVLERGALVRGIRLRPEIVGVLLGENAARLRNTTVQLDDVFGARRARDMRRPEALDRWLTEARPDERVARALRCLDSTDLETTARTIHVSPRQIRRLLLQHTGLSPKAFQRVRRLQRFVALLEGGLPLARIAPAAGYADQPHLSREVRALTGLSPRALAAERCARSTEGSPASGRPAPAMGVVSSRPPGS